MKSPVRLATAVAVMFLAGFWAVSSSGAVPKRTTDQTAKPKVETYSVVQIGEEVKVVKKSELTTLRKSIATEDKQAAKAYEEAKKASGKDKDKDKNNSELVKPVKRKIKVLKGSLKTEQEANDWMEKHLQQQEKDGPKAKK